MGEEPRPQDEMRPITALFADIVGSTGLGERLGPDEVKALVGEWVTRMSRAAAEALERRAAAPASFRHGVTATSYEGGAAGGGPGSGGDGSRLPAANEIRCAYAVAVGGRLPGSFASACRIAHESPSGASARFVHGSGGSRFRCALARSNIDLSAKGARPAVHSKVTHPSA